MTFDSFSTRHIGPRASQLDQMLRTVGAPSLDALMDEAIPPDIRLTEPLSLADSESEIDYLKRLRGIAGKEQGLSVLHRDGLLRLRHPQCHPT